MPFPQAYISYSQLSKYEHCPRCYYLSYFLKLRTPAAEPLIFGSAVHNNIDAYHKFGFIPNNIDRRVRAAVQVYADRYPAKFLDVTEERQDIIVRHPDTEEPLALPVRLIIDGYRTTGLPIIAEHKTAAAPWPKGKVDTEFQTSLYSLAFRQKFGYKEDHIQYNIIIKPKYGTLFKMQVLHTKRDTSDYAAFWYWAKAIMDKIAAGEFPSKRGPGYACDLCKICK